MSYRMAVRRRLMAIALAGINVAKLVIAYTGAMTDQIVTMGDGKQYRLLTLTSSGTLTIEKPVQADIWMCGGGSNHGNYASDNTRGGGGGYVASGYNATLSGSMTAVVGAAEGASSFAAITANGSNTANGGSGGGGHRGDGPWDTSASGKGAGVTTYPFGDTTFFSGRPHSAGGGGGGYHNGSSSSRNGGAGGTNGSDGYAGDGGTAADPGRGGSYGGGYGGRTSGNGSAATFYGGGGGGGGCDVKEDFDGKRGAGYQGVIYVRIPLDQKAA